MATRLDGHAMPFFDIKLISFLNLGAIYLKGGNFTNNYRCDKFDSQFIFPINQTFYCVTLSAKGVNLPPVSIDFLRYKGRLCEMGHFVISIILRLVTWKFLTNDKNLTKIVWRSSHWARTFSRMFFICIIKTNFSFSQIEKHCKDIRPGHGKVENCLKKKLREGLLRNSECKQVCKVFSLVILWKEYLINLARFFFSEEPGLVQS